MQCAINPFRLRLVLGPRFHYKKAMTRWKRFWKGLSTLQSGRADRVIFYYYGEDPTYLDDAFVTVYRNGVVEVEHRNEHVTTHAQNVEILWQSRQQRALSLVKNDSTSV